MSAFCLFWRFKDVKLSVVFTTVIAWCHYSKAYIYAANYFMLIGLRKPILTSLPSGP